MTKQKTAIPTNGFVGMAVFAYYLCHFLSFSARLSTPSIHTGCSGRDLRKLAP